MNTMLKSPADVKPYLMNKAALPGTIFLLLLTALFAVLTANNILTNAVGGKIYLGVIGALLIGVASALCARFYYRQCRRGYTVIFGKVPGTDQFYPATVTDQDVRMLAAMRFDPSVCYMCVHTVDPDRSMILVFQERWFSTPFKATLSGVQDFGLASDLPQLRVFYADGALEPVSVEHAFDFGARINKLSAKDVLAGLCNEQLLSRRSSQLEAEVIMLERARHQDTTEQAQHELEWGDEKHHLLLRIARLLREQRNLSERLASAVRLVLIVLDKLKARQDLQRPGLLGRFRIEIGQHLRMLYPSQYDGHDDPDTWAHLERELRDSKGRERISEAFLRHWFGYITQQWWFKPGSERHLASGNPAVEARIDSEAHALVGDSDTTQAHAAAS